MFDNVVEDFLMSQKAKDAHEVSLARPSDRVDGSR
jgi:hypothetical protein